MRSPDLNLLKQKIGLADAEDFPWVHEIRFYNSRSHPRSYALSLGSPTSTHSVSLKFLRCLLNLSRLDRKIDQRKRP